MTINIDHLSRASNQGSLHGGDDTVPLFWRFFVSGGLAFPPICKNMDVVELLKDSEELRSVIDERRNDAEGVVKEVILRFHLMLKVRTLLYIVKIFAENKMKSWNPAGGRRGKPITCLN